MQARTVFNGDDAFFADFFHRFGNDVADVGISIRRDRADLRNFFAGRARLRQLLQLFDHRLYRFVDAALEIHRVHAGGNELHAFLHDRLREHRRGGGAVAGDVGSFAGHFFHHLRAHVFEFVFQFDFFRDRHTVFGDRRGAERALEHDVAAFRAEGHFDRIGQDIDTRDDLGAG